MWLREEVWRYVAVWRTQLNENRFNYVQTCTAVQERDECMYVKRDMWLSVKKCNCAETEKFSERDYSR